MITPSADERRQLVLLADDDPTIGLLASETLRAAGLDVIVVSEGNDVLREFKAQRPHIVLLDVDLPGKSGFSICEELRRQLAGAHVPIIMITGHDDTASVSRAYAAGATDFINKPILWPVLPHRIKYMLRSHRALNDLQASEQRNRALLQAIPDMIFVLNTDGLILECLSMQASFDVSPAAGEKLENVLPTAAVKSAREHLHTAFATGLIQTFEYEAKDGKRVFEARLRPQNEASCLVIVRDITERKQTESRMHYLAYYDNLTGLPNRQLFIRELRRAMKGSDRSGNSLATLYIDLDRFKRINDTLGHTVGDALLQSVAKRLENSIRPSDMVTRIDGVAVNSIHLARFGGDEFVCMIGDVRGRDDVDSVARRICQSLSEPYTYERHQFVVTPSIGIAFYPQDGHDVEDLIVKADMAMFQAKASGRNSHAFYSDNMNSPSLERLDLENDLRKAISEGGLTLFYQPKVDVNTLKVMGVEALLRWLHPTQGYISPESFIPLAEETGVIVALGEWVIRAACRQLKLWQSQDLEYLSIAVNVSTQQFNREDFVDSVLTALWESGVKSNRMEIEVTESVLMHKGEETTRSLQRLRDAGIKISIDDFGTGYSSLGYLKQFPVDTLKIDRSFVKDLHPTGDDAAICAAIIAMARELNLTVVAEGVELQEQLEFLRRYQCHQAQGFLFSKPVPAEELSQLLNSFVGFAKQKASS